MREEWHHDATPLPPSLLLSSSSRKDHMARRFARPRNQICCGAAVVNTGKDLPTTVARSVGDSDSKTSRVEVGTVTGSVALPENDVPSQ